MASKYVNDLKDLARVLTAEGWTMRAGVCDAAAARMERMEEHIIALHEIDQEIVHEGLAPQEKP